MGRERWILAGVVVALWCGVTPATAQRAVYEMVSVGCADLSQNSALAFCNVPTTAGTSVLAVDTAGDGAVGTIASVGAFTVFGRGSGSGAPDFLSLAKGHLPSAVAYEDEANLFAPDQEFGADVLPETGYAGNLGLLNRKWLTLHAAELWVETLVAQNTLATIGGRILVGPTTTLTIDHAAGFTDFEVEHNNLAVGDTVYLEANGSVEFVLVLSGPTGTGPYTYGVQRNMDGSGANAWPAGSAVFNTGAAGDGFLDLYSVRGVRDGSELGPTIAGNVRESSTYNDWAPRWAVGNLRGICGYASDIYGALFGDCDATNITIEDSTGFRIRHGTTNKLTANTSGDLFLAGDLTVTGSGTFGNANVAINASGIVMEADANDTWSDELAYRFNIDDGRAGMTAYTVSSANTLLLNVTDSGTADIKAWADSSSSACRTEVNAVSTGTTDTVSMGGNGSCSPKVVPLNDSTTLLGTSALRWDNINLDLPNNPDPTFVVVNRGGGGADDLSALGYVEGVTGTVVVKGSDGNNCNLIFEAGILTAETCP